MHTRFFLLISHHPTLAELIITTNFNATIVDSEKLAYMHEFKSIWIKLILYSYVFSNLHIIHVGEFYSFSTSVYWCACITRIDCFIFRYGIFFIYLTTFNRVVKLADFLYLPPWFEPSLLTSMRRVTSHTVTHIIYPTLATRDATVSTVIMWPTN